MKTLINCWLALLFVVAFMGAGALTSAIDNAQRLDEKIAIHREYAGTECRLPDPLLEYRITIEHRTSPGKLVSSCYIEPLNREESPAKTMQRLLDRKRT